MQILVTGAGGFVGRNICEKLLKNPNVNSVTGTLNIGKMSNNRNDKYSNKIKFIKCDLTKEKEIDKIFNDNKFDVLIHCAAVSTGANDIINRPYLHVTDNAIMGSLIFRKSFEKKIKKVIFISCSAIYRSSNDLLKEEHQNAYEMNPRYFGGGWTKVYLEKQCEFYAKIGDTKFIIIRHSNMFGSYDDFNDGRSHMVAANLKKVFKAKDGEDIIVWGTGRTKRDLLHIDELSSFIDIVIKSPSIKKKYNIYNLGASNGVTIENVVKQIIRASGKNLNIKFDTTKPDIDVNIFLDCSKAKSLGWEQQYSFDEAIKKTYNWIKENPRLILT